MSWMLFIVVASAENCTVGGHGPYPSNYNHCLELCKNQALTNCILKGPNAKVEMDFIGKSKVFCRATKVNGTCQLVEQKSQPEAL